MKIFLSLKKLLPLIIFFALVLPLQAEKIPPPSRVTATVIKVIDGDTLKVKYHGQKESVRLIGIDAPESRLNKKAIKDVQRSSNDIKVIIAQGKLATKFVKTLVRPGDTINLEFDVQPRDRYGRLLNYVYLDAGKMLNEEIVRAGYAGLMTIPPNVKYEQRLLKAYREARERKRGLWGEE